MTRYRWVVLAAGAGAQGAFAAVVQGLPSLGPALRESFSLSLSQLGLVLASGSVGAMLTVFAWGVLADRIGERIVIVIGLGGSAAALVGASLASDVVALIAALALSGMLSASAIAASGRAVAGWFGRDERGFALGIRHAALPLAAALAALALPGLAALGGVRASLLALAAVSMLAAAFAAVYLRDPPGDAEDGQHRLGQALRDPRLLRLIAGAAAMTIVQWGTLAFVVTFLHEERGLTVGVAAAVLSGLQLAGGVTRVVTGRISDRRGQRVAPLRFIALAQAVVFASTAALLGASNALLLPVVLLGGSLAVSWQALPGTIAAEVARADDRGGALGFQTTVLVLAAALTPPAFGALVAATSWAAGFGSLAAAALISSVILRPLATSERTHGLRPA
jgi:sugar phosphate permease